LRGRDFAFIERSMQESEEFGARYFPGEPKSV
jgi:hypothetical protein